MKGHLGNKFSLKEQLLTKYKFLGFQELGNNGLEAVKIQESRIISDLSSNLYTMNNNLDKLHTYEGNTRI